MEPTRAEDAPARTPITAATVAQLPYPGTVVPRGIEFTPDGQSLTYLHSETESLSRVLWRATVATEARPRVVARAPGGGDTDATLSREEQLRRERQRVRDTGISQISRAEAADVAVMPLGGDLYLLRPDRELRRLTRTSAPELDPRPSHDGQKIAFVRDGELFVIDATTEREVQLSRGATAGLTHGLAEFIAQEELGRSSGFWWSPDGSKIAYQQTDERHIPSYTITHQDGPQFSTEVHRYPFAGAENATIRLGVVSSAGGATTWLRLAEVEEDFYLARVQWDGPTQLLVQLLTRDQKALRLYRFDLASGEKSLLVEEKSSTYVNLHNDLRVLNPQGELLWSSERTGFRHLEVRDRYGKLLRTLTSGDWPVDGVVQVDETRGEVWFLAGREDPLQAQLYRVPVAGGAVVRVSREPGTHLAVVARDGNHYVDTFSNRKTPPATTVRTRDGQILSVLDDAGRDARIAAMGLAPPRLTEFQNRDGDRLLGAYYAPKIQADAIRPGSTPLVVLVYGGPHVQTVTDTWSMTADLTAQFLAQSGFAVWKADNRGSARRGVAFESALHLHMGEVEVRDQEDGVRFVVASQPEVDPLRVGISGGSYGGYMTLRALMLAPDTFKAGVAIAPVTDWDGYDTAYTERYMSTPAENPQGYKNSSVLAVATELVGDLLLIHGMLDENVHFRHSARLCSTLIAAGKRFTILPIPGERHSSRKIPERTFIAERTVEFFRNALQSGREPGR